MNNFGEQNEAKTENMGMQGISWTLFTNCLLFFVALLSYSLISILLFKCLFLLQFMVFRTKYRYKEDDKNFKRRHDINDMFFYLLWISRL